MPWRKKTFPFIIPRGIDAVYHGLVGRKYGTGIGLFLAFSEIAKGEIRHQIMECPFGLCHKSIAVSQKQQVLDPAITYQHIGQRDDRPSLTTAGSHNQQGLTPVPFIKGITNSLDGFLLVIAVRYFITDAYTLQ